jgi:alpha-ribazole phosphatase
MKLLLVRHGETDWNAAQRFQGQSDVPLNGAGVQQAIALGNRLWHEHIDVIYVSDLQRAHDTARLIAEHHSCKIHADSRLREISFGTWEGQTYDEIKKSTPSALAAWEADILTTPPPNGETLGQLTARVGSMLSDLRTQHADQTLLIVAHGGPLQVLLCLALNLSPSMYWQFHLSPASLSEIAFYPAGAILNLLNDTAICPSPLSQWEPLKGCFAKG